MIMVESESDTQERHAVKQLIVRVSLSRSAAVTAKDVVPPTWIVTLLESGEIVG